MTPSPKPRFYVAGTYGEEPTAVCDTIETAMMIATEPHGVGGLMFETTWTCEFIDGDPDLIRCTATLPDDTRVYVEACTLENYEETRRRYMKG